jgi:uncharacterized protein YidB (DUF937 family)
MAMLMQIVRSIIMKLFAGNSAKFMQVVTAMLANKSGSGGAGGGGGLADIIAGFQKSGMGKLSDSWVGTGPNEAVTPAQIEQGLGKEKIQELINQTGMKEPELLDKLSKMLPGMIDKMTPEGKLPG